MAQSRWRYVREGRHGEGILFCARRCITLRYTPRYEAETTYSRLRVFCSNGDVSGHLVNGLSPNSQKLHATQKVRRGEK